MKQLKNSLLLLGFISVVGYSNANAANITQYSLNGHYGIIIENGQKSEIKVSMPYGTNIKSLTAEFTTTSTKPITVLTKVTDPNIYRLDEQISRVTVNNFEKPVIYDVDGKKYTVIVQIF